MKNKKKYSVSTLVTRLGRKPKSHENMVNPAVQRGSTVLFGSAKDLYNDNIKSYGLEGTSTHEFLQDALSEISGGNASIICPSGLSAITLTLMTFAKSGGHILVTDSAYRPTRRFCDQVLKGFGVEITYFDPHIGAGIENLITPKTNLIILESPGSLTFELSDIPVICEIAKKYKVITAIDDTWSAGIFFKPLEIGVDISMQALTKYQSGHSDVLAGALTVKDKVIYKKLEKMHKNLGLGVSAEDAWLCLRGLRTMALRMNHQDTSARKVAQFLESHEKIARVIHPALESHPDNAIFKRDFSGAGGLFSFILKPISEKKLFAFLESLEIFGMGFSWGGYESLIVYCNPQIERTAVKWQEKGYLIRVGIGLEDTDDLIADLNQALKNL